MSIIALLLGILLPALAKARKSAQQIKCATQIKQIHTGFLTQANDDPQQNYPMPGEINRMMVSGANIPGRGDFNELKIHIRICIRLAFRKICSQQPY